MKTWRQTRLGPTATKSLTIIHPDPAISGLCQPPILSLPVELLLELVKIATRQNYYDIEEYDDPYDDYFNPDRIPIDYTQDPFPGVTRYDCSCLLNFSRVCRKFRQVAQPLLFRSINYGGPEGSELVPPSDDMLKLHRTLKESPHLRQHCRAFLIDIGDGALELLQPSHYHVAQNIVEWLNQTRILTIKGGFDSYKNFKQGPVYYGSRTWSLIRHATVHMQRLEHVSISNGTDYYVPNLNLYDALHWLKFTKLKKLELDYSLQHLPQQGRDEFAIEKYRTAPLTHLKIKTDEQLPLYGIFQWPATLTHVDLWLGYSWSPLSSLQNSLLIHKDTLKHAKIGKISDWSKEVIFNATLFPKLEHLELRTCGQHPCKINWKADHENVLGSSLKTFGWYIADPNEVCFGEKHASWLVDLATWSVGHKAILSKIEIHYYPEYWSFPVEDGHPWGSMLVAKKALSKLGVELIYPDLKLSKDKWLEVGRRRHRQW